MPLDTKAITVLTQKHTALAAELAAVNAAEPRLQTERDAHLATVEALPAAEIFSAAGLSPATAERLADLQSLETRLGLLPKVRTRLAAQFTSLTEQIRAEMRAISGEVRNAARERMVALRAERTPQVMADCGGDALAAKSALDTLVSGSIWAKWDKGFGNRFESHDVVVDAQRMLNQVREFEAQLAA